MSLTFGIKSQLHYQLPFFQPDLCQNNHYVISFPTVNVTLTRTINPVLGSFNTADTFITCSSNTSNPSCQYRKVIFLKGILLSVYLCIFLSF